MKPCINMQRILRSNSGFTLVEMLAATLVLGLLTSMVAMGVTLGMKAYQRSSFESEAQILASTLDASLSDPLRFSTAQATDNNSFAYQVTYRNNTITNVQLTTHEVPRADGKKVNVLAFESESGQYYDITNVGAYTNCTVTEATMTFTPAPEDLSAVGPATTVKVELTITSAVDSSLSQHYTFTYVPLNATKESDTSNNTDTNTDESGTTTAPTEGAEPTTYEASLTDAWSGWSSEFRWYTENDTDNKTYYVAAQGDPNSSNCALIFYKGNYYKCLNNVSGQKNLGPVNTSSGDYYEAFSTSWLGDGEYHQTSWSAAILQWVLVS